MGQVILSDQRCSLCIHSSIYHLSIPFSLHLLSILLILSSTYHLFILPSIHPSIFSLLSSIHLPVHSSTHSLSHQATP